MIISLIAAVAENDVLGKDNAMIWHLPKDMKWFKDKTLNHYVIMGRKTFDALGKPLSGRTNIIITRQKDYKQEGCRIVHSLEDALKLAQEGGEQEAFIIGGAEIYKQALPHADIVYLTEIYHKFEGDAFFPKVNHDEWELVYEEKHEPDEKNKYRFAFCEYKRKRN